MNNNKTTSDWLVLHWYHLFTHQRLWTSYPSWRIDRDRGKVGEELEKRRRANCGWYVKRIKNSCFLLLIPHESVNLSFKALSPE